MSRGVMICGYFPKPNWSTHDGLEYTCLAYRLLWYWLHPSGRILRLNSKFFSVIRIPYLAHMLSLKMGFLCLDWNNWNYLLQMTLVKSIFLYITEMTIVHPIFSLMFFYFLCITQLHVCHSFCCVIFLYLFFTCTYIFLGAM